MTIRLVTMTVLTVWDGLTSEYQVLGKGQVGCLHGATGSFWDLRSALLLHYDEFELSNRHIRIIRFL